jgi:hypothetical protein
MVSGAGQPHGDESITPDLDRLFIGNSHQTVGKALELAASIAVAQANGTVDDVRRQHVDADEGSLTVREFNRLETGSNANAWRSDLSTAAPLLAKASQAAANIAWLKLLGSGCQ